MNFGNPIKYMQNQRSFYILTFNFNTKKVENYDVIPYLTREVKDFVKYGKKKVEELTDEELKTYVDRAARYEFWARCQWEFMVISWPYVSNTRVEEQGGEKIDAYRQIKMNLDVVTQLVKESL